MIRQFIHPVRCQNCIVVIAQEWPCWLSATIALKLPLMVAFITKLFQLMFNIPQYAPLSTFADMWEAPKEWNSCTVLALGSKEYLGFVQSKLKHHEGPFIYSTNPIVKNRRRRDIIRLLDTWARSRKEQGLKSAIISHADFGGVTSAIHIIGYRHVDQSVFMPPIRH
jgi:hypothetical protein